MFDTCLNQVSAYAVIIKPLLKPVFRIVQIQVVLVDSTPLSSHKIGCNEISITEKNYAFHHVVTEFKFEALFHTQKSRYSNRAAQDESGQNLLFNIDIFNQKKQKALIISFNLNLNGQTKELFVLNYEQYKTHTWNSSTLLKWTKVAMFRHQHHPSENDMSRSLLKITVS